MIERVLLVAWKGSPAAAWVGALESGGFTVLLEDTTGERAWRTAKERGIDCVIIDGQKKPSHGRQTGNALRDTAKTRDIPIIWTNLVAEDVDHVQSEVRPDVLLRAPTDATGALAALHALKSERADQPDQEHGDHESPTEAQPPSVKRPRLPARKSSAAREANATGKRRPKARVTKGRTRR